LVIAPHISYIFVNHHQNNTSMTKQTDKLQPSLTPTLLWGLGVGYVISGLYFGWNLGLQQGGTLGMAIATGLIVILYICFSMSYAELACAIPQAGGVFDYTSRALGSQWGFVAGIAQIVEFVFAPPAIALAIGAHVNLFFPSVSVNVVAVVAYFVFTFLNIRGVKLAATFELVITILAVIGLLLFIFLTIPQFNSKNLSINALPNGWAGVWAAIPFAIWFFLGIEGLANAAEESVNPQRDLTRGFGLSMLTLVVLCIVMSVCAVGLAGWEAIVFKTDGTTSDSPLPLALAHVSVFWQQAVVFFGLCGLIASFHGLLMAGGRATCEMGRTRNLPKWLGYIQPQYQTPANALVANMLIGIAALLTNSTADIIVLSVLGALTLYIFGSLSVLILRKTEPNTPRPFSVPAFPVVPIVALVLSVVALGAVIYFNQTLTGWYVAILVGAMIFKNLKKQ
jgi:ethanolamine permease